MLKFFIFIICICPISIVAQQLNTLDSATAHSANTSSKIKTEGSDSVIEKYPVKNMKQIENPKNALFIELAGKSGFYTLNYEFRLQDLIAASIGVGTDVCLNLGAEISLLPGKGRHRFESLIGFGYSYGYPFYYRDYSYGGFQVFADCGYRYQKKNGIVFRLFSGLRMESLKTSNFSYSRIYPHYGLSLGYSK